MVKVPGWYLWIDGSETQISAANKAHCNKVLYGENKPISFYKSSFTVFIKFVKIIMKVKIAEWMDNC